MTALSCAVLAFVAVAVSCQEPTQITVRITTGEPCSNMSAVQTIVGPSPLETQSRFERGFATGQSERCDPDGFVGTLVVTPGGDGGSILVAVGVRGGDGSAPPDATRCADPETAKRCIVARRTFSFIDHKPLTLPIHLDPLCIGKVCDPASTCFKGGCVDASVVCNDADCRLRGEDPGGVGEGGASEASSSDGAYDAELDGPGFEDVIDGGLVSDAMPDSDAAADSGTDGPQATQMCAFSNPVYYCNPGTNGTVTAGSCETGTGPVPCCRCICPSTMATVGCTSNAACSNLNPSCPP